MRDDVVVDDDDDVELEWLLEPMINSPSRYHSMMGGGIPSAEHCNVTGSWRATVTSDGCSVIRGALPVENKMRKWLTEQSFDQVWSFLNASLTSHMCGRYNQINKDLSPSSHWKGQQNCNNKRDHTSCYLLMAHRMAIFRSNRMLALFGEGGLGFVNNPKASLSFIVTKIVTNGCKMKWWPKVCYWPALYSVCPTVSRFLFFSRILFDTHRAIVYTTWPMFELISKQPPSQQTHTPSSDTTR